MQIAVWITVAASDKRTVARFGGCFTPMRPEMSDNAKTLLHYAANYRSGCADDSDRAFCFHAAREYAAHLITSL